MRQRLGLLLLATVPLTAWSTYAVVEPVASDVVTDQYRPFSFNNQQLSGLLADRMRANVEGYLEHQGHRAADQQTIGQYLQAAANAWLYTRDRDLGSEMDKAFRALSVQEKPNNAADLGDRLLGLVSYYRVTGNPEAWSKCKQIGDALLDLPPSPVALDAVSELYRYSGDRRYLDYCRKAADSFQHEILAVPGSFPPRLATLVGLADLYRLTGEGSYLKIITDSWGALKKGVTPTGALAGSPGHRETNCGTAAWMQLTLQLFQLTGRPEYGEELERSTYNQLLAAQDGLTGNIYTEVPLNGTKALQGSGDCQNAVAQALSMIPASVWGHYGRGFAVNLYAPGSATVTIRERRDMRLSHKTVPHLYRGNIRLYEETNFPQNGDVLLHVEPDYDFKFPVRLRVPSWTSSFEATIGTTHITGKPGQYVFLNRRWKRGDTVHITMSLPLRSAPVAPANKETVVLLRGPQVLSVAKVVNPELSRIPDRAFSLPNVSDLTIESDTKLLPSKWSGDEAYRIQGIGNRPLMLVPYADAKVYRTTFSSGQ